MVIRTLQGRPLERGFQCHRLVRCLLGLCWESEAGLWRPPGISFQVSVPPPLTHCRKRTTNDRSSLGLVLDFAFHKLIPDNLDSSRVFKFFRTFSSSQLLDFSTQGKTIPQQTADRCFLSRENSNTVTRKAATADGAEDAEELKNTRLALSLCGTWEQNSK